MSNPAFGNPNFWRLFFKLEDSTISNDEIEEQLSLLRQDFQILEEPIPSGSGLHDSEENEDDFIRGSVQFHFPCGDQFSLLLDYAMTTEGCDKHLSLLNHSSGEKSVMGWWDLARWHPYCLRVEELDRLLGYWANHTSRWSETHLPLLLLCQFVGLESSEAQDALTQRAKNAIRSIGVQKRDGKLPKPTLRVPEDEYRWELDEQLGWVFTSDEYCCYSLRNRPHAENSDEEGRFPFEAFRQMLDSIPEIPNH